MHLWKNDKREILNNKNVAPHSNLPSGADPYDSKSYEDFELNDYAPELMHNEALGFIERNKKNPFFLYYASPLPHVPLQAPRYWVDHYRKIIGDEEPFVGKSYFPNQYPKASYAAMISYLDEQVGDIVKKLKEIGVYENTLIIFTSDNGPTFNGGTDTPYFNSAKPFKTEYGWAKCFVNEGGIRVPMIAHWPKMIKKEQRSNLISAFQDMMPTFCDIAGIKPPKNINGISLLPTLMGNKQNEIHEYLYWEFPAYNGQQAVRMNNWKAIRKNIFDGNMQIELYDLKSDLQEQNDISKSKPEIVNKITSIMQNSRTTPIYKKFKISELGDI